MEERWSPPQFIVPLLLPLGRHSLANIQMNFPLSDIFGRRRSSFEDKPFQHRSSGVHRRSLLRRELNFPAIGGNNWNLYILLVRVVICCGKKPWPFRCFSERRATSVELWPYALSVRLSSRLQEEHHGLLLQFSACCRSVWGNHLRKNLYQNLTSSTIRWTVAYWCRFDSYFSVQVSNTEGQIYSLFIRSPHFRWIQDFSSIDKLINVVPGNNGHLYLVFPRKATVMSLDVSTGTVSWQSNVGPLSSETTVPVVDSNGKQLKIFTLIIKLGTLKHTSKSLPV